MVDPESTSSQVVQSWDTYWQGAGETGAYSSGGVNHPAILTFWEEFFQAVKNDYAVPGIFDVASGSGAVVECALSVFTDQQARVTCLDVSDAAITNIRNRYPGVQGIVADARSIPLDSAGFDVVTSQFGVEYAGVDAIDEAARLVADGGQLALLLHHSGGSIHQECATNLDAILRLQESRFVPYSKQMLAAGFEAVRGADRAPYEAAATRLAPAVQVLEDIMSQYGEQVAGDTIARLYGDVDRIHRDMPRYDPAEVLEWLTRMDGELEAYAGRMSSMCQSAMNHDSFDRICTALEDRGYTIDRAGPLLTPDQALPLAWVLVATHEARQRSAASTTESELDEVGTDRLDDEERDKLQKWVKSQLDSTVRELMKQNVIDSLFLEAKPAWVLPFKVLIGRIRRPRDTEGFKWFVCGEVPTDHLGSSAALTPRKAARHFALKWQLDGARLKGSEQEELAQHAEALYELAEDEKLWSQKN